MNLTIKNIPEKVYKTLKQEAADRGRSLNAEAILALTNSAEMTERRSEMKKSWPELQRFVASLPKMSDSTRIIRAERDRR